VYARIYARMCATEADLTVSNRAAREPTKSNKNTHTHTRVNGSRQRTIEVKHHILVRLYI